MMALLKVDGVIERYFTDSNGKPMISRQVLYKMARRKQLPSMKIGNRVFFSDKALDQWIAEQNVIPIQE